MIWHSADKSRVLHELETNADNGLSNSIVEERMEQYGKNVLTDIKKPTFIKHFTSLLFNKLSISLGIMAILSYVVTLVFKDNTAGDYYIPILIIGLMIVGALLESMHRYNSEKIMNHIHAATNPDATVIREGVTLTVPSSELVVGDIILFSAGDYITADARLIDSFEVRCNESVLTEESVPVEKSADYLCEDIASLEQRNNMVYAGTSMIQGNAKAVVVATGLHTELGHAVILSQQTEAVKLPVQKLLNNSYKYINILIGTFCILYFLIDIISHFNNPHFAVTTVQSVTNTLALAVAAVPSGIPVLSSVMIALGIERILRDNILIKKAEAAELLGRTTVLCVDKTGILTHNSMSLSSLYDGKTLSEIRENSALSENESRILKLATACHTLDGDATENAIEQASIQYNFMSGVDVEAILPRLNFIPFDPEHKIMTTVNLFDGKPYAISKGATELLIEKCINCDKETIIKQNDLLAESGQRILCIAMRELDEIPATPMVADLEQNMTFVGLIGFSDPPRNSAIEGIKICDRAGIKTIMITGDNPITARAVARRMGILKDGTELLTGTELNEMSDAELSENIENYSVFARVSPYDKVRIIKAWQHRRHLVTATGDSAEDFEALATADIGCAVGQNGTDVARGSADIIITNNSFSSIVDAIKESRGLFENIRKSVFYLLSCNFAVLLAFLLSVIIYRTYPFPALQLLWLNLLIDCAPFIALGFEKAEDHVMHRRPLALSGHVYDRYSCISGSLQSIFMAIMTLIAYQIGGADGSKSSWTMAFCVMSLSQVIHVFNLKTTQSIFAHPKRLFTSNRNLNISAGLAFFVVLFLIFTPFGFPFGLIILPFNRFLVCFALSFAIIPFCEIVKIVIKRIRKY